MSFSQVCTFGFEETIVQQLLHCLQTPLLTVVLCHTCCAARFSLKHNEKRIFLLEHVSIVAMKFVLRLYLWSQRTHRAALKRSSQYAAKNVQFLAFREALSGRVWCTQSFPDLPETFRSV